MAADVLRNNRAYRVLRASLVIMAGVMRYLVLRIRADGEPARVWLDRTGVTRASGAGAGWNVSEDGFVELRLPDKSEAFRLTLEAAGSAQAAGRRASDPCVPPLR